ncbi:MAG TPA: phage holin family protein [Methylophilaceae bacterium]|nr:phage holin family protein [Methylophilaceae bacterium]
MSVQLTNFLIHWAVMSLALWVASHIFKGISFSNRGALLVSALVLGFLNAILRPILFFLTFPLTLLTFGLFLLVINALIIMITAKLVNGFKLSGFWTAFFASIFIAIFGFFLEWVLPGNTHLIVVPSMHTVNI